MFLCDLYLGGVDDGGGEVGQTNYLCLHPGTTFHLCVVPPEFCALQNSAPVLLFK
jgi:hypothetical protein